MIPSSSRLFLCASLVLTLSSATVAFSQSSSLLQTSAVQFDLSSTLPDSPSYSSSQSPEQGKTQAPADETPEQRKARERAEAERQIQLEEKQRIGGIIPNFNVQMGGAFVPLNAAEKWSLSWHTILDPYTFGLAFVVGGGIGEIQDDHRGYHWGTAGYFKRTGASYLDNVDGNLIGNFLLPVVLRQDPRYFRKGEGKLVTRVLYSAMTTFVCKGNNGKRQPNISNVAGNFLSGAISNVYYPHDERGVDLTINNAITVTLEGMLGAQLLEFSPDVSSYIHKRKEHHRMILQQKIDADATAKQAASKP